MKKIVLLLILVCITLFGGCTKNDTLVKNVNKNEPNNHSGQDIIVNYETAVAYANWTSDMSIMENAINNSELQLSSRVHLPIYKMESLVDLEQFIDVYDEQLTMDHGYSEVPSFLEVTSKYDEDFFEKSTLFVIYLSTSSGSLRFNVSNVLIDDGTFCVYVTQTNNPEICTDDMAGWFFVVAIENKDIAGCKSFDSIMGNVKID